MISVIVPIYNVEKYVEKCINSLIHQTYSDFEIILVDDGSSDSSSQICDKLAAIDSRIIVIHKKNGGANSARAAGLHVAKGTHIMYVDGDDWIETSCVEKIENVIKTYSNVDLICFSSFYSYSNHNDYHKVFKEQGLLCRKRIRKEIFPFLIEDCNGSHFVASLCGKVFKRDWLEKIYYCVDERITVGEDGAVTRPYVFKCNSIFFLDEALYYYNQCNSSSMTKARKPIDWNNTKMIRSVFLTNFPNNQFWLDQINRNTTHNMFITCITHFNSENAFIEKYYSIKTHLEQPYFREAITNCKYYSIKGKAMYVVLKYRLVILLYLYWRFRK